MVEWKKIWEVTTWDKKFQGVDKSMQSHIIQYSYLLAKDLFALSVPNGNIKLLSTGVQEGWTTEEVAGKYICEGEVVSIPWGKSPGAKNPVKYYKGKFVTGDNRIATSTNTNMLNNKYLYYWLINNSDLLETFYRGAGIQHPSMFMVLTMDIPIPSLSEQTRIVGILDTFTASIENLKEQIAERRKQYEYYRNQLLDLEGKEGVEMKKLGEMCDFQNGFAFKSELFKDNGEPIIRITNIDGRRVNLDDCKYFDINDYSRYNLSQFKILRNDILVAMSGATTGKIGIYESNKTAYLNQRVGKFKPHEILLNKYLYHLLIGKYTELYLLAGGGAQPNLSSNKLLRDVLIPLTSLYEQQRIVSILDTFEASIANLEAQLKEREKQYEFYRNKLLTFE